MGLRRQWAIGIFIVGAALIATSEASPTPVDIRDLEIRQLMKSLLMYLRERMQNSKLPHDLFIHPVKAVRPATGATAAAAAEDMPSPDFEDPDRMDFHDSDKRQFDDYGHMRFGKRGPHFDDYGHMRFGRSAAAVVRSPEINQQKPESRVNPQPE